MPATAAQNGSSAAPTSPAVSGTSSTVRPAEFLMTMRRTFPSRRIRLSVALSLPALTLISSVVVDMEYRVSGVGGRGSPLTDVRVTHCDVAPDTRYPTPETHRAPLYVMR